MKRKRQVEERVGKIGLKKEDAADTTKWRNGVYELYRHVTLIRLNLLTNKDLSTIRSHTTFLS